MPRAKKSTSKKKAVKIPEFIHMVKYRPPGNWQNPPKQGQGKTVTQSSGEGLWPTQKKKPSRSKPKRRR